MVAGEVPDTQPYAGSPPPGRGGGVCGDEPEARAASAEALDLARRLGMRGYEASALRIRGEAWRLASVWPAAADAYASGLGIADSLGMRPLVAHCHLSLGKLYRRTGQREQAQEHLTMATAMYREMGMTYWLEQAEAATPPRFPSTRCSEPPAGPPLRG